MAKGSFRGVPFNTIDHDTTIGRRQPTYAVPFQDNGARSIDIGRAPRVFNLSVCVLGPDYRTQRDNLMQAFEQPGPGLLVHPEHGRLLVTVDDKVSVRESTDKLLCAEFRFTVTEAADQQPQKIPPDTAGALRSATQTAQQVAATTFADPSTGFSLSGVADFVRAAHLSALDDVLNDLEKTNAAVSQVLSIPAGAASQIDAISQNLTQLASTPAKLFEAVQGALVSVAQSLNRIVGPAGAEANVTEFTPYDTLMPRTVGGSASLLSTTASFAALGSDSLAPSDADTEQRALQRKGFYAIRYNMRASALFALADTAIDARYDSAGDARAVRDGLANALVDLSNSSPEPDPRLVDALHDVAGKVVQFLTQIAGNLTTIVAYAPPTTLPVEVIAWTLYGDAGRADEIVARNNIPDPSAVPGLQDLEVKVS